MTPGWYYTAVFLAAVFGLLVPIAVHVGRRDQRETQQ